MTKAIAAPSAGYSDDDEISLFALGSILLRARRMILVLGLLGGLVGLAAGLLSKRKYVSGTTFIPQGADAAAPSGLAMAASQFGIRLPGTGGTWGPPIYVELLRSRSLLEPIARDTITVPEEGGRRIALMDLLEIDAPTPARRTDRTVRELQRIVFATEDKRLGAVRLTVTTPWPSVSLTLAERLVRGVNEFILNTRKSQATAERQFVEAQASEAEHAVREAEDRLQEFLQTNRAMANSPALGFQRDRLQREVALRQQVYASLTQSREDARIREVRDTPVLTVLESPRLPVMGEARNTVKKALLGGFAGVILGSALAFLLRYLAVTRESPNRAAREFFDLLNVATPRLLRRGARR